MKKVILRLSALFLCIPMAVAQTARTPEWTHNVDITNSDRAVDIWVNPEGETYAFGRIVNYGGQLDALVITKTDNQGQELWRRFMYAVSGDWQLFANAVVGDEIGNLYCMFNEKTRYTDSNRNRIAIRKYSPDGDVIWDQYLTESVENRTEEANRRVFEYKNGSLYVLGSMYDENLWTSQGSDGVLYKVDATDGSILLRQVYNSSYNSDDMLKDLTVNDNGEIWAIGRSKGYVGPGGAYSNYDSITLKWNANGELLWERRLNGNGNGEDYGINLTVDAEGNCYTSNQVKRIGINALQVTIEKLAPTGALLWSLGSVSSSTGYTTKQPIALMPGGNVVFSAATADGIQVFALNPDNGSTLWSNNFNRNNLGAQNRQSDMIIDEQGNCYVTGSSRDNTPFGDGIDMTTLKYDSNGQFVWYSHITFGNYATAGDFGDVLHWNPFNQSLYVMGSVQDASFNNNYLIAKYNESGLGIADQDMSQVVIYPNPVKDLLHVGLPTQEEAIFDVYDSQGRGIRQWTGNATTDQQHRLDFSGLPEGVYLLKVTTGENSTSVKVVKQ